MRLIVGLGNPGAEYAGTRHNMGFAVIDRLASERGINVTKMKQRAQTGEGRIGGEPVLLAKPMTYMNNSGESVAALMRFYKLSPKDLILVYDDCDLPVAKLRVRQSGSAGGHNGVKSVIWHLQTDVFDRLKVGIGEKPDRWDLADYVLSRFSKPEQEQIDVTVAEAAGVVEYMAINGAEAAMNKYNG